MKKDIQSYQQLVINARKKADNNESKLIPEILEIGGMSGSKGRHFLNNLVFDGCRYLEIGSHRGSTLCSALYKNNPSASFSIDNFSQFGDDFNILESNIKKYGPLNHKIICEDCYTLDIKKANISDIDIYFFDGPHAYSDHLKALTYYIDAMADTFIYIVDDWSGENVRDGTWDALSNLNIKADTFIAIPEQSNTGSYLEDSQGYWNGLGVFVISKNTYKLHE